MAPSVPLTSETFIRLQSHAEPFLDTPETVINRALDALESCSGVLSQTTKFTQYDAASPPSLTHTKVLSIELGGERFVPNETYWNYLLFALARKAAAMGRSAKEVKALVAVNAVLGEKNDNGYRFIPEAGISVQGQDSNGAWKGIHNLATSLGVSVDVSFEWYDNPKAANPGGRGRFLIAG